MWLLSSHRAGGLLLALVLGALLSACGFTLQGARTLAPQMQHTFVQTSDARAPVTLSLNRALRAAGASLSDSPDQASAVLRLLTDQSGERILSVSPTGVPEEYELFHTLSFAVDVNGDSLLAPETITVTRDYRFDANDVLGKRREAQFLQQAMVDDLVQLLMRRLDLLARAQAQ